jgi:hypothetical protein
LAVFLVALLGSAAIYRATIDYGFTYDDYHQFRPYTSHEVVAAFHGSWDPTGIEVAFYRPLTVAFYAARFAVLGPDARASHCLSLLLFGIAAALLGLFLLRLFDRLLPAIIGTTVFLAHPAMPYALVAWSTNQMHLVETILVLAGLVWWIWSRARPLAWWLPLLAVQVAVFLVKEDGIMLLPCVIVLQYVSRLSNASSPPPPRGFIALSVATLGALVLLRQLALGGVGGYGALTLERAVGNLARGPWAVFLQQPPDRPGQRLVSLFVIAVMVCGLVQVLRDRQAGAGRFAMAAGAVIALLFDAPFAFVSKAEQMHLVATGAVLVLTGGVAAMLRGAALPLRAVLLLGVACGVGLMALVSRNIATDFAPCSEVTRAHDRVVIGWPGIPVEIKECLAEKACGTDDRSGNPIELAGQISYGAYDWEQDRERRRFRWIGSHATMFVSRRASIAVLPLAAVFLPGGPSRTVVTVQVDGRFVRRLVLGDEMWNTARVRVPARAWRFWRPAFCRIDLDVAPTWSPAALNSRSDDRRQLGVKIGEITWEGWRGQP